MRIYGNTNGRATDYRIAMRQPPFSTLMLVINTMKARYIVVPRNLEKVCGERLVERKC